MMIRSCVLMIGDDDSCGAMFIRVGWWLVMMIRSCGTVGGTIVIRMVVTSPRVCAHLSLVHNHDNHHHDSLW